MTFDFQLPPGVQWSHLEEGPDFGYPVNYKMAVLGHQIERGSLDMLVEFAPNSYCHFHRHIAKTSTLVLRGEQHVYEFDERGEKIHKVRKAGEYAHSTGPHDHMECGGPEGSLVFFSFQEPTGHLFDMLDADRNVLGPSTIREILESQQAPGA